MSNSQLNYYSGVLNWPFNTHQTHSNYEWIFETCGVEFNTWRPKSWCKKSEMWNVTRETYCGTDDSYQDACVIDRARNRNLAITRRAFFLTTKPLCKAGGTEHTNKSSMNSICPLLLLDTVYYKHSREGRRSNEARHTRKNLAGWSEVMEWTRHTTTLSYDY
jgi:hypothetical protein